MTIIEQSIDTLREKSQRIDAIVNQIAELQKEKERLKKEIIQEAQIYKIGEETDVKGFSYTGRPCRITSVELYEKSEGLSDIHVTAQVLQKDGKALKVRATWSAWRDPILRVAFQKITGKHYKI